MSVTGHGSGRDADPVVQQLALVLAITAIGLCWPVVYMHIPVGARFAFTDLVREHWAHRNALEPWFGQRWAWLAAHDYHLWFALASFPGVVAISVVHVIHHRTPWPLVQGPLGSLGGALLGYMLYQTFRADSSALAVMMPPTFAFLGGAIAARLSTSPGGSRHLRGTRLRIRAGSRRGRLRARLLDRVTLAGVVLSREDETMHVAAIGTTGSGKSTALRALMADATRRGDRQVVADPDGAALAAFFKAGDVILNPFDRRCARWDLLAEIKQPSDYAFIAQSLLPHLGEGEHDQWITYAQHLLAGAMENFVTLRLGSSAAFVTMLAGATVGELKQLCVGTPAARYFEEGGERMLASILGTLAPAIGHLRLIAAVDGEPFSIRDWVQKGTGSLWMPYAASQVAAVRGLISCWMNIAIIETLSCEPSPERRIWFHIDELDALGRIEGLKDALARLRKVGGRVAIGFQSFAQVRQVYGEGAHTIIENCGNLLLLRSGTSAGGGTARLVVDLIGDREVERGDISQSRSRGKFVTRSTSMQTRRSVESAALASEITQLPSLSGFVKRATGSHWARVTFPFINYPARTTSLAPRCNDISLSTIDINTADEISDAVR